jgi:selenocysteine lyase/cysteine desulfurase
LLKVQTLPLSSFPYRTAFAVGPTYLDNARRHPIPISAAEDIGRYADGLRDISGIATGNDLLREQVREQFASLIHAAPEEIALVPSTVFAENLILSALGLPKRSAGIVTDTLHFGGSLYLYESLRAQGYPVTILRPEQGRISVSDYADAIRPGTKLVALSLVAATTGFQHDVAAIAAIAHDRGALVYADIIQAAGTTPIDVRALDVDFCACATYKWLMGDMGAGFLFVRSGLLSSLRRPVYGAQQLRRHSFNGFPYSRAQDEAVCDWDLEKGVRSLFEVQTFAVTPLIALRSSLQLLHEIGVADIEHHRQPLLLRAREGLIAAGLTPLTPEGSRSAILSFSFEGDRDVLIEKLARAGVRISIYETFLRVSPTLFNDIDDMDCLIDAIRRPL